MAARSKAPKYVPILGGFLPFQALWDEGAAGALFPSETSARWFVRENRDDLVDAEALAMHTGRLYFHPERLAQVARRLALAQARRRKAA